MCILIHIKHRGNYQQDRALLKKIKIQNQQQQQKRLYVSQFKLSTQNFKF